MTSWIEIFPPACNTLVSHVEVYVTSWIEILITQVFKGVGGRRGLCDLVD